MIDKIAADDKEPLAGLHNYMGIKRSVPVIFPFTAKGFVHFFACKVSYDRVIDAVL